MKSSVIIDLGGFSSRRARLGRLTKSANFTSLGLFPLAETKVLPPLGADGLRSRMRTRVAWYHASGKDR